MTIARRTQITDMTPPLTSMPKTVVTAQAAVRHGAWIPLRLDGEDLTLVSIHVNDAPWTAYIKKKRARLSSATCQSVYVTHCQRDKSGGAYGAEGCTSQAMRLYQCEAEGFRHITRI